MAHHERMNGGRAHLQNVLFASNDDFMTLNCGFVLHDVLPVVFNLFGARFGRFRFLCQTLQRWESFGKTARYGTIFCFHDDA